MKERPTDTALLEFIERKHYFSFKEFYKDVSAEYKITYRTLNKRFNRLVAGDYLDKTKYNLSKEFELSDEGKRYLLNHRGLGKDIMCRTHDLMFKCPIIKRPSYAFRNGFKVNTKIKNWKFPQYYTKLKNGTHIQTSDNLITIRIKEMNSIDSDIAIMLAFQQVVEILTDLMSKYPSLELNYPDRVVDIIRSHHAIRNKQLKEFIQEFQIKYKDDRIQVDCSKGSPEIEFIHPAHSQGDFTKVIDFLRYIAEGEIDIDKLRKDYGKK